MNLAISIVLYDNKSFKKSYKMIAVKEKPVVIQSESLAVREHDWQAVLTLLVKMSGITPEGE